MEIPEQQQDFCSSIHRNDSTSLAKELEPLANLMQNKTGVYVLEDGDGAMVTRAWLTEYAEKTIDIQYFIFSTDNVGLIACDYLVRAADRGVKIRILVDDIMVDAGTHEILTMDSHENISIKIYNPGINIGKNIYEKLKKFKTDFNGANQRMHNKTFIVDNKVLITGGRNIADEYFDYNREYNFRDRDVLLIGKVTKQVEKSFNEFWNDTLSVPITDLVDEADNNFNDKNRFNRLHQYACNPENFWPQVREKIKNLPLAFQKIQKSGDLVWLDSVDFISDFPGKYDRNNPSSPGRVATIALMNLIKHAKTSIEIQSPYLITTEVGQKLFRDAVNRGVKVRVLTNSLASTDNLEAFAGYQSCRKNLLETGIKIYEFKPDAAKRFKIMTGALQKKLNYTPTFGLHAKSMVVDGNITVIGTFNLDPRSANYNTECFAVIYSSKIASGVLKGMEEEFKPENSWETTLVFNPDSEAGKKKQLKAWTRKLVPKEIL
ncbi:MAG: phospholipase D family protein [Bacteroidota bacterium]|nr:phospholipase D family protein [Bacteroidota bacterium]